MKKRYIKITTVILVILLFIVYFKSTSLKFHLNVTEIYSVEYGFDNYNNGNFDYLTGEITDKAEISKIVNYFNSISLLSTLEKPKDATQWILFKNKDGNEIEGYAFGFSVLWDGSKTYVFGDYYQNRIKKLLSIEK